MFQSASVIDILTELLTDYQSSGQLAMGFRFDLADGAAYRANSYRIQYQESDRISLADCSPALQDWGFHKRVSESWVLNTSTDPNADALILGGREVTSAKGKVPILYEKYRSN